MEYGFSERDRKIKSFRDLYAWQEGHELVLQIYAITKYFPAEEIYGLTSQIKRAVVSITSNISEGFGKTSYKDKHRYFVISHGSLLEVENQLTIASDLGYIPKTLFDDISRHSERVHKILNALIKKTDFFANNS
jgi:four helix bundle protein